jgi:hypothetical protein
MAAQGGLSLLKNGLGFIAAQREAKAAKAWQAYRNKMVRLADGQNQNVITTNSNMARERSAEAAFAISRSKLTTEGSAAVAAAAMGVEGRSVDMVQFDIGRNAAYAQQQRLDDLNMEMEGFRNQRRQSAMQAIQNIDLSPIPKPNPASYMLGFTTDIAKLWQDQRKALSVVN